MGAADLVPGISGGTVAFILGIYEWLIGALSGTHPGTSRRASLLPLSILGLGITTSLLLFSRLISSCLANPELCTPFFALFVGLILGSIHHVKKRLTIWTPTTYCVLLLAGVCGLFVALSPAHSSVNSTAFNPLLILFGMVASGAMLLPGISGSYILVLLGVYPQAIDSLKSLTDSLLHLHFSPIPALFLAQIGFGVLIGLILFSKAIRWLLIHFHDATIAALIGLMIGSLPSICPWNSSTLPTHSLHTWISLACIVIGFSITMGLEALAKQKGSHSHPSRNAHGR